MDKELKKASTTPKCLGVTVGVVVIFFVTHLLHSAILIVQIVFGYKHR
jgi:hypothetical protein